MQTLQLMDQAIFLSRRGESSGSGLGCFIVLAIGLVVAFLVFRGRRDRAEQLGSAHRPMGSGNVEGLTFACPYAKCPTCGAAGDKMKQAYDGLRKVTWTCGYCGSTAGVQELKDEELPAGARQRLGLDGGGMVQGQPGYYPPQGGGMGNLLTGMMLGSMLGGGHDRDRDGWGGGSAGDGDWGGGGSSSSGGSDWGDSGGGDSGGSDWGDSGGGDSGGSDF